MAARSICTRAPLCATLATLAALTLIAPGAARAAVGDRSPDRLWVETGGAPSKGAPAPNARVYQIDTGVLERFLKAAPLEGTPAERLSPQTMTLPMPDGTYASFRIVESPVLSPELARENLSIQTFAGEGVDDPRLYVRFDRSPLGFHALIKTSDDLVFIEPVSRDDLTHYVSYPKSTLVSPEGVQCSVMDDKGSDAMSKVQAPPSGAVLRTYRMAISATGEYTTQFGGRAGAIQQITSTVNQVNVIYRSEVAIQFNLVCFAIAPNGATDRYPAPGTVNDALLDLNTTVVNDTCGAANYDIGHLFHRTGAGTGYSGRAHFAVVCDNANKADGASTGVDPTSSLFLIDLFAHETGHMFNARHIFNSSSATLCTGARSGNDAYEISSGTTIMSYAFSGCAEDIPGTAIPFFNAHNFEQITDFRDGAGACGSTANSGNTPPTINAGPDRTIPRNTPFTLTATGNDADGDALTYQWEQHDLGPASPPLNGGVQGPIFRGFNPSASPSRTFPNLTGLLGGSTPWEFLPTIDRTLTFRCTARDQRAACGGVNYDTIVLTVSGDPFVVTAPNGGEVLTAGCATTVTWTVGGGSVAANVNILLSTNGGNSFTALLSNTPNDGSQSVTLPCTVSPLTQCRIMVQAVDNYFFDVSDNSFQIQNAAPVISGLTVTDGAVGASCTYSAPFTATVTDDCGILASAVQGVTLSLDGRATVGAASFIATQVTATEVSVSGTVPVSALTSCPASCRLRLDVADACGRTATAFDDFTVTDNTPPQISIVLSRTFLWPPNHSLSDIHVDVTATDNCGGSFVLTSITSSEPENGLGDGDTAPDIVGAAFGTADTDFQLRSERGGGGAGRVYTITYTASDNCGSSTQAVAMVRVAHDQSGTALVAGGLDEGGRDIDPDAQVLTVVVPSLAASPSVDDPGGVVSDDGGGPVGDVGTRAPLYFDARTLEDAELLIGNARGVVAPLRQFQGVDATGDELADRVLMFAAAPVRELLAASTLEDGPLGLHYVTRRGDPFLVPDLLALGEATELNASAIAALGAGAAQGAAAGTAGARPSLAPGAAPAAALPATSGLAAIRPNPFAGSTEIAYDVAKPARIRIAVYDALGRFVRTLEDGTIAAGRRSVAWDGRNAAGARVHPGIYYVRFERDGVGESRKAILMP